MEVVVSSVIIVATKPTWKWQNGILKLEANVLFCVHWRRRYVPNKIFFWIYTIYNYLILLLMSYLTRILKIKILKIIRNVKWFIFEKKLFSFLYQKSVNDAHCIVNYIGPKGAMKAILFLTLEFFLCFLSYFFQNKWLLYSRIFWWGILHGYTFLSRYLGHCEFVPYGDGM